MNACRARIAGSIVSGVCRNAGSRPRAIACDHTANRSRSSNGTPSISPITSTGRGFASAAITSAVPSSSARVSKSAVICSIRGVSCSTIRGVKAFDTSRRSRVWSGGLSPRKDRITRPDSSTG